MAQRIFGEIPGISEGHIFESRNALAASGVHRPRQAGISGGEKDGADSIVLSGGYVDDEDSGTVIIYTGHGGRDPDTAKQISDQLLTRGNLALARCCIEGLPVRVVRGHGHPSPYSPRYGYCYDGLFRVESYWRDTGRDGYNIWRFRLVKLLDEIAPKLLSEEIPSYDMIRRAETTILRVVRDTRQARIVKQMYDFQCQVCDVRLTGSAGPYAEAAHIRPLGRPHRGPDEPGNILCLCPNHHVMLDYGGFSIADNYQLLGIGGVLMVREDHEIDIAHIRYHRQHFYGSL